MRRLLFVSMLAVIALTAVTAGAASLQRAVPAKADVLRMQTPAPTGRIVIKFTDASELVVTPHGLDGSKSGILDRVAGLLADKAGNRNLERRFSSLSMEQIDAQRASGERRIGGALPNLNRYGHIDLGPDATQTELLEVLARILADPAVETAFLEPKAVPASLGFDAFTGKYTRPEPDADIELLLDKAGRDTPDYSSSQGYLGSPPAGVNAWAANGYDGARGGDMQFVDIEGAWVWNHEDLPTPFYTQGVMYPDQDWRDHGTAVVGEIVGQDNGYGVRGVAPDASAGSVSAYALSVSACINYASNNTDPGDIIVIELHAPGPNSTGDGQFGYVPMEYWQDNFDAIEIASANGRVVCEAAGNGSQNLDDAVYINRFNRDARDSGAIFCGAGNSSGWPYSYSNNGSRLDLNGWGGSVVTCGYGDLQGAQPETEWYTAYFSGTSSATPIVAGAVIAFQGMVKAADTTVLDPIQLRTLMADSGTPQQPGNTIGPRPDIIAAFTLYNSSLSAIAGTITDTDTTLPIEGVTVTVVETGDEMVTGADGQFGFDLFTGLYNFEYSHLLYIDETREIEIVESVVADGSIGLTPLPRVTIVGRVTDHSGGVLADVDCIPSDPSLPSVVTDAFGKYVIENVAVGSSFGLSFEGLPFHGAEYLTVTPEVTGPSIWPVQAQLADATYTFQWWHENFVLDGNWAHGRPAVGPGTAFSDTTCLGIGMDGGGFPADGAFYLTSPSSVNYSGNAELYLSFHYWCNLEENVDGVKLQYKIAPDPWFDIAPLGGYTHDDIEASGDPGWSGDSGGWRSAVFDISDYTEDFVLYRWVLESDSANNDGFYLIDDVTISTGDSTSPVPENEILPSVFAPRIVAQPNPFNPTTRVRWTTDRPGHLSIKVYDARGRLVRTLEEGYTEATSGETIFNGQDRNGRNLASGTYLVRVSDGRGQASTTRVSLVK